MKLFISGPVPYDGVAEDYERAALLCLQNEEIGQERMEISIVFVDDAHIRELNSQYRGIDSVTDVLSFPQYESVEQYPESGDIFLGDVVISIDAAVAQAEEYGHGQKREFVYLFVHSILHLLGYDHMDEEERMIMRQKEEKIMSLLNLGR